MCFSPLLLYTSDLRSNNTTCTMVKYADDDTSLTGCVSHEDETGYRNDIHKKLKK